VRKRAEDLLAQLGGPAKAPEALRGLRVLQVLEQVGSPEARQVLAALARGRPEDWLTREARGALERLAKRPGG
jgi:hypothetical protein